MRPYYQDDAVTLHHGDCLELADLWTCPACDIAPALLLVAHLDRHAREARR